MGLFHEGATEVRVVAKDSSKSMYYSVEELLVLKGKYEVARSLMLPVYM